MNRTLGFFLGSAVVFAMLVFILGQPVHLASPPVRDLRSGTMTTTSPIRIPAPVAQHEPAQAAPQPVAKAPVAQAATPPVQNAAAVIAAATPSAQPETVTAATVGASTDTSAYTELDENKLAETWLASTPGRPLDDTVDTPVTQAIDPVADAAADLSAVVGQSAPQEWYPVWDPFHSELSANAFARRLERVTGLDYRVMKTSPTQYRVVVGYISEEQRLVNVTMIEQATGLSINGGSL